MSTTDPTLTRWGDDDDDLEMVGPEDTAPAPAPAEPDRDLTPEQALIQSIEGEEELPLPEDFDPGAWLEGIRPTVRRTNIYARGDLVGELDDLTRRLEVARNVAADPEMGLEGDDARADVDAIEEEMVELYREFIGSGITFRVEGRSEAWRKRVARRVQKLPEMNRLSKSEREVAVTLHQLAGQIVSPPGITYEHLVTLRERSEPQLRKLIVVKALADNQAPKVTVPFSSSSSGTRGGRRRT